MKVRIETERLLIRPLRPEDARAVFRWCGDPRVNRYMIYPLYQRVTDVRAWLESRNPNDPNVYDEGIVLRETGELIGSGGLTWIPERNAWEVGYNLRADQWGHGYTVEMLRALIGHIRKVRPMEAIEGTCAAANLRSRRVMEKLGMVCIGDTTLSRLDGSETFEAKLYRLNLPQPPGRCPVCDRIARIRQGSDPGFVLELGSGHVVLGAPRELLLLCREHAGEPDHLSPGLRDALLRDASLTREAVRGESGPPSCIGGCRHLAVRILRGDSGDGDSPEPEQLIEALRREFSRPAGKTAGASPALPREEHAP